MEMLILIIAVLQSMAISLGVGSSTLAILNFFVAVKDGKIDETERHFMGITYIVLRVAMVIILFTTLILAFYHFNRIGADYFSTYTIAQIVLITVLYLNALLMTLHLIPSTLGPALQASTWYTLGFILAFFTQGYENYSLYNFALGYIGVFIVAFIIVNSILTHLRYKNKLNQKQ